jgi:prepilin-type N-terminal cleavage/methylation domain-containing protein
MNATISTTTARRPAKQDGFTLLEMLVSVAIMAMLVLMLFTAFHQGQRGWIHGEKRTRSFQEGRRILDTIANDVALAITSTNASGIWFRGDSHNMYFVAPLATQNATWTNNTAINEVVDLAFVGYQYVSGSPAGYFRRQLTLPTQNQVLPGQNWDNHVYSASATSGSTNCVITSNIVLSASFKYINQSGAEQNNWSSTELPRAVRIYLEIVDPETVKQIQAGGDAAKLTAAAKRTFQTQIALYNSR